MPDDHVRLGETLYERDFHGWAVQQAAALAALRLALDAAPPTGPSLGDAAAAVDLDNLIEEIEGLARKERQELTRRIGTIVEHLTKLENGTDPQPRSGWKVTVTRSRDDVAALLAGSPSLRHALTDAIVEGRQRGSTVGWKALRDYGDTAGFVAARARATDHFDEAEILGDWFPEPPAA